MKWSEQQVATLRSMYPVADTFDVARAVGRSRRACMIKACELGIKKTRAAKRTWTAHAQLPSTWGFGKDPGKHTRGKPAPNRLPIGSEFVSAKGAIYVKVAMTGQKNVDWKRKSHVAIGRELLPDEVVSFIDGNSLNCNPDNLVVRTKQEVLQEVSIHNYPKDIGDLYRAKGQIIRAINRRTKK